VILIVPDRWKIYFGDVCIGDIGPRAGVPTTVDQLEWYCGFVRRRIAVSTLGALLSIYTTRDKSSKLRGENCGPPSRTTTLQRTAMRAPGLQGKREWGRTAAAADTNAGRPLAMLLA
jgi:hypothetical protein